MSVAGHRLRKGCASPYKQDRCKLFVTDTFYENDQVHRGLFLFDVPEGGRPARGEALFYHARARGSYPCFSPQGRARNLAAGRPVPKEGNFPSLVVRDLGRSLRTGGLLRPKKKSFPWLVCGAQQG